MTTDYIGDLGDFVRWYLLSGPDAKLFCSLQSTMNRALIHLKISLQGQEGKRKRGLLHIKETKTVEANAISKVILPVLS